MYVMNEGGTSNETCHQLQPKKIKVRLYQPLILQQKVSYAHYITNKMEHDSCRQCNAWALPE